ncbi:MAG: hypothetical protein NC420_13600 [Eubacterium sp.]|nr:hypothetical protein [Eubacterium sp.]
MALLAFLKACCRNKYTPYIAMVMYVIANIWNRNTYNRYCSSLPQEFGMIFILPSIYFLFAFFEDRKRENGAKGWKVHSTRYLLLFVMSFSATIGIHFYNAMIVGFFCVGIGIGFAGLIFRREYFGRIMLAGISGVLLAALPMVIAVAMGKPLQGSLGWGMNIIKGTSATEAAASSQQEESSAVVQPSSDNTEQFLQDNPGQTVAGGMDSADGAVWNATENAIEPPQDDVIPKPALGERLAQIKIKFTEKLNGLVKQTEDFLDVVQEAVLEHASLNTVAIILSLALMPGILGLLFLFPRKTRRYGSMLVSIAIGILVLYVMMIAKRLGVPELMNRNRSSIYLAYMLPVSISFVADALFSLFLGWLRKPFLADMAALMGVLVMTGIIMVEDMYKKPLSIAAFETNEAITCVTNILRENPRFHFTICSANDELRMIENDGYHYEIISFLRAMEGEKQNDYLTIPTDKVYFFIEKIPIDYDMRYEGSGSKVSEEGAGRPVPYGAGITIYKGINRHTVMSRMYYWAQAFQKMYPNEMRVYYETDAFICYEVEQNTYRLFDFSIDYGYNSYSGTGEEAVDDV